MKKVLLISTISLALSVVALAQTDHPTSPFNIHAGFSYLVDKNARSATSNGGWTVGGSYDFFQGKSGERYSADVDYDDHRGNGNSIQSYAFQLAVRAPFSQEAPSADPGHVSFYYGAGIGVFRTRVAGSTTTTTTGTGTGTGTQTVARPQQATTTTNSYNDTKSLFGGSLILGANFGQNANVELYYRITGSIDGTNTNTLGLALGWRF